MYVVVYRLHGFNPFLVCLMVLCTAIVLSANRQTHFKYTVSAAQRILHLINSMHSSIHYVIK